MLSSEYFLEGFSINHPAIGYPHFRKPMETHILVDMHPCLPGAGYSCVEFFATSLSVTFDVLSSRGLFEVSIWNYLDVCYMYTTCMLHVY